ncbi:MAG: hypothetical protein IJX09_05385, partial [Clostridia bacterium]|nr:hypothetical protein [Clostridia bacterium]
FLTVEAARANAKTELASYKNAADYREAQQTELAAILAEANADIDTKDSVAAMSEVVAAAKSKIDALKTDAQYTAEELAQAKDSAKAELATYKSIDDYRDAEKTAITTILANATTAIDSAANKAAVETVVTEAKSALDALKTDAQYTAEEAAALATAKDSAKTELATYKNADDYREAEKTALASILATANTTIDACENAEAVGVVVAEAKAAIDELKTAAEYEAEEAPDAGDDEPTGTPDASSKEDESTETPDDSTDGGENEGGCGSSVHGLWAALIVAMLFVGVAVLKKKREN